MRKSRKISVITACHNNETTIAKTIESLLDQDYENIEYIIVDGQSTDETLNIVGGYKKEILEKVNKFRIISESDEGLADAWNKGLQVAKGEVIFFLNSDDWLEKNTISLAMREFGNIKNQILYGQCNRFNLEGKLNGRYQNKFFRGRELWNFGFSFTTCFISSEVFKSVGNFNKSYNIAVDSEFLLRCIKGGVKFLKGNHKVNMREGGLSLTHRDAARAEYKNALINNGYPSFIVGIAHFIQKKIRRFN